MPPYTGFEQGPIRPPSEADSLLIRVNRNCPWNRCTFCSLYKKRKFSIRPVEDVIRDIDTVHHLIKEIAAGAPPQSLRGEHREVFAAWSWYCSGMESVFLQDADSLTYRPDNLLRILHHLRDRFPLVKRITCYARSASLARTPDAALKQLAAAGLNRIHVGMETGSETLLKLVRKGVTKEDQVVAGLKVKGAGIELSEYFLAGLGGTELSHEHAGESADVINRINPDFIRFRALHIRDGLDLFPDGGHIRFRPAPDLVLAREIRTFLERLDGITSAVRSDHGFNLFQEINGAFPGGKERMVAVPVKFMELEPEQRVLYQVGKRTGHLQRLDDLQHPERVAPVRETCRQAGITAGNVDERMHEMMQERMRRGLY
ncbi:radical SAM protein [Geomonas anaerohicana]|uniref:Radical SAM protein n=1 Tax=Geomonas anaerohicana TaxID=2798583 RepID=A0ABS0YC45_9BACT|nr:radical SAM protein [Geomonas anaerohicana]MBJ6749507.1 radical SAM protein [Geomonas anaerohicana]